MAEPLIPVGAFAAMKAGNPLPTSKDAAPPPTPKTVTRKAEAPKAVTEPPKEVMPPQPPANLTPAEKKIWKLKADGEEFDFDASDEEAIKREIMKARGADKRFKEAAMTKQQAETFFQMLKDPVQLRKVLQDPRIGADVKKLAYDYVLEEMEEAKLSPEQKAQKARDKELEELKAEKAKDVESKAEQDRQKKQVAFENEYEQKITKALEIGGIPKTQASVSRMAEYLANSLQHNLDLSPEQLVQQVRNDYLSDFNSVLSAADGDQLLALIGEANAEKLRKADLKRIKSTQDNPFPKRSKNKSTENPQIRHKKLGATEWKKDLIDGFLARK